VEVTGAQSIFLRSLLNASLFLAQSDRPNLNGSSFAIVSLYLIKKTGKWSLMSHNKIPLLLSVMSETEVKILSMSVAELDDILVGLLMTGNSDWVKLRDYERRGSLI